ncbi:thiol-disulfide oxidoreductase DCC family protein [Streptomyces sclerotialus]|uniref:thiol-disulfide oxidoreductase DCC family protein n=1 Tax=Streptomyces sclerotialus TaxID=1957 RepID=UPI00099D1641
MRTRPVLVFDGDCSFCTSSVRFIERHLRPRCASIPWQRAPLASFGVPRRRAEHEVLWVTPTNEVHGGAQAVAKLLMSAGKGWAVLGATLTFPPMRWLARALYQLIAHNRHRLPGGTPACALPADRR